MPAPVDLTVSIDGYLDPVTQLPEEAIATLRQAIEALPISDVQRDAMGRLLEGVEPVMQYFGDDARTDFTLRLNSGELVSVRLAHGDRLTQRERLVVRYQVERLPTARRAPRRWSVRNLATGEWVQQGAAPLAFSSAEAARGWIVRQASLADCPAYALGTPR